MLESKTKTTATEEKACVARLNAAWSLSLRSLRIQQIAWSPIFATFYDVVESPGGNILARRMMNRLHPNL